MSAATKEEREEWIARGKKKRATHLLIVCDSFSYEDYPVFVAPTEDVDNVTAKYNAKSMQRVVEVVALQKRREPKEKTNSEKLRELKILTKDGDLDKLIEDIMESIERIKNSMLETIALKKEMKKTAKRKKK